MKINGTIVLLHGFGMHQGVWDDLIPFLESKAPIKVPKMSHLTFEDLDEYVQWVHHYLETERVKDPILVGFSMGGYIALGFAEKYPKILKGLVLFHSSAMADTEARKMARQKTIEFIKKNGAELFLEEFHPKIFGPKFTQDHPEQVKQFAQTHGTIDPDVLIAGTQAMKGRKGRMHILTSLPIPIGMIIGGQDPFISKEDAIQQVSIIQKPYVLMLDDVGHAGMVEAPDISAQFLLHFAEKCSN